MREIASPHMPYFLKIEAIAGGSADAKHKGEIDVESFSFGVSNEAATAPGGGGSGRPAFEPLNVVTPFSKASPRLLQACATGEHLRSAVLTGSSGGGKGQFEFMRLTLSDVLVSAYGSGVESATAVIPSDGFSLSYSKLQIEHKAQSPTGTAGGSTVAGFDLASNQTL